MGLFLYFGFAFIAFINQYIVLGLFAAFMVMSVLLIPHVHAHQLFDVGFAMSYKPIPIVFTSFGFLAILPSIRTYLDNDLRKIKKAIVYGSGAPLLLYIIWLSIVLGVLPVSGSISSLSFISKQSAMIPLMTSALSTQVSSHILPSAVNAFMIFAIGGSFLGSSVALFDCLYDVSGLKKSALGKISIILLLFAPISIAVLSKLSIFVYALTYAGLNATVLFALYPVVMVIRARSLYRGDITYLVPIKTSSLFLMLIPILALIIMSI